jgi:hypothetical protein
MTVGGPRGAGAGWMVHGLNRTQEPARLLFVFPTQQVERVLASIWNDGGFPSERA